MPQNVMPQIENIHQIKLRMSAGGHPNGVKHERKKAGLWQLPSPGKLRGKVIEGMRSRNIPLVSLDMPALPKLPPQMEVITAPLAYIRLHGRNSEVWWGKDDHAWYDYLYTDSEIKAWAKMKALYL
jgi:hypothetical protein